MIYARLALCFAVLLGLTDCNPVEGSSSSSDQSAANAPGPPPPDPVVTKRPPDEQAVLGFYDQAFDARSAAPNQIAEDKADKEWTTRFCSAIRNAKVFKDWTGNIRDINERSFTVEIGDYIKLSYIDMKPGTPLYTAVAGLKEGAPVLVSGSLDPDSLGCDVFTAREFEANFTSLAPLL